VSSLVERREADRGVDAVDVDIGVGLQESLECTKAGPARVLVAAISLEGVAVLC